ALRAVGTVVRRVGLAADEQDRAVGALLAQPARAVRGGEAASDQQVVDVSVGHGRDTTGRAGGGRTSGPSPVSGRAPSIAARLRCGWAPRPCRCGWYRA